jgi:hypothetical protein
MSRHPERADALLHHKQHIHIQLSDLGRNFKEAFQVALDYRENLMETLQATRSQTVTDPHSMIRRIVRHYRGTKEFADLVVAAYEADPPREGVKPTRFDVVKANHSLEGA